MNNLSPDQIPEKWGAIASAYETAFEKLTSQFADDVITRLSPKTGDAVLDVAAGTGSFSLRAAKLGADVLATNNHQKQIVTLASKACVGIAHV